MASSSEFEEKQSGISDVSSEYTMDTIGEITEKKTECNGEELEALPPELQEMVQRAMSLDQ